MATVLDHGQFHLVFGTDSAGRHLTGSARTAVQHYGATLAQSEGLQGRSYAIPVRNPDGTVLPYNDVRRSIETFLDFAASSPDTFLVTHLTAAAATDLPPEGLATLFADRTANVWISRSWELLAHPGLVMDFRILTYCHPLFQQDNLVDDKLARLLMSQDDKELTIVTGGDESTLRSVRSYARTHQPAFVTWQESPEIFGPASCALRNWALIWYSDAAALFVPDTETPLLLRMCKQSDLPTRVTRPDTSMIK